MNRKELMELRRRFRGDKSSISRVYGCYVNSNREIISQFDTSLGMMQQEEQEIYLSLLKKALTGTPDKNLIPITFSTQQVLDSEEHRLLQTLRQTALQDQEAREALCRKIIESMDMGDSSYLILLAADAYDVPGRSSDGEELADASEQIFRYVLCSICPVKAPEMELRYVNEEKTFHGCSSGHIAAAPDIGFLFPAFDNRCANIYSGLYYSRDAANLHPEVIDAVFHVLPPMSAPEQKDVFDTALRDSLQQDCSFEVVQAVHEQVFTLLQDHRESRDPESPAVSVEDMAAILQSSGASAEQAQTFRRQCQQQYGTDAELNPGNLVESRKFEVTTPEVKISVSPENSYLIETRVIQGRKYLLIPASGGVQINGIDVSVLEQEVED